MELLNIEAAHTMLAQLRAEHLQLDKRLKKLNTHLSLTPDEQLEKKEIQKLKLLKKDQMNALENQTKAH
jgi:hypothetical protein